MARSAARPLTPWESPDHFADMVGRFMAVGIVEFVTCLPGSWRPQAPHERRLRAKQDPGVVDSAG